MRNNCLTAALAISFGLFAVASSPAQEKKPGDAKSEVWMKAKLEASHNILDGLTKPDFAKIRANAEAMSFLGFLESWTRGDMQDYKRQVVHFDFANRELIRQAREENLEGATLAYNQLVVSCVQCHRIVRDAKK
jgi:cytochrome c556